MSGIVCPSCSELVAFDATYCPACGALVRIIEQRAPGEPHPFHDSITPGRRRVREGAARALARLDARRETL